MNIKVRLYHYLVFNILILGSVCMIILYLVFFIYGAVNSEIYIGIYDSAVNWLFYFLLIVLPWWVFAALVYFGCKTYDIYTEYGFIRMRKKHWFSNKTTIIYYFRWEDIDEIIYTGIAGIIILRPNVLIIFSKEGYVPDKGRDVLDDRSGISVKLSRRNCRKIRAVIPEKFRN